MEILVNDTSWFARSLAKGAVIAAMAASALLPGLAHATRPPPAPVIPPEISQITVTDGSVPKFLGHATGTQNYTCEQTSTGTFVWTFVGPQATLVDPTTGKEIAIHYADPVIGPSRPDWQAVPDGSIVGGSKVASGTPNGGSGAIPWLRLTAVAWTLGPDGGDKMFDIVDIQRVNTTGGLAPTSGCEATTVGAVADVPYTADYYFYHFTS
jgi:hypothetical protein